MPSANLKRIAELEAELKRTNDNARRLTAEKYQLTVALQRIADNHDGLAKEQLQSLAHQALTDNGALKQLQQRDLLIARHTVLRMRFPTELRKMWSGGDVQRWLQQYAEVLQQRAMASLETGKDTVQ